MLIKKSYKDHQGSVLALSDEEGKIVESYRYDAWGNIILGGRKNSANGNGNPSSNNGHKNTKDSKPWLQNTRLYTAREYEPELGLYYYRARYYDAKLGKFINRDPLLYIDGLNPYTYVNNNPVNFIDPWGLRKNLLLGKNGQDITQNILQIFNESRIIEQKRLNDYLSCLDTLLPDQACMIGNINRDISFAKETLYGESNLKMGKNSLLGSNNVLLEINDNGQSIYYLIFNGECLYLANLGNILYGYRGYYAGYNYSTIEDKAGLETKRMKDKTLKNEEPDRPFYKFGYKLAKREQMQGEFDIEYFLKGLIILQDFFHRGDSSGFASLNITK